MSLFCQDCSNEVASQYKFCPSCGSRHLAQGKPSVQAVAPVYQSVVNSAINSKPNWQNQADPITATAGAKFSQMAYAGFWRRAIAYVIDGIILFIFITLVELGVKLLAPNTNFESLGVIGVFQVVYLLAAWVYYANMESGPYQATWGKRVMHLRVCDLNGERITFGRACGRFFASGLSGLCLGIGYLMVAFTEYKQGMHDKIAKTFVIHYGE